MSFCFDLKFDQIQKVERINAANMAQIKQCNRKKKTFVIVGFQKKDTRCWGRRRRKETLADWTEARTSR